MPRRDPHATLLVLTLGGFGRLVGERLGDAHPGSAVLDAHRHRSQWPLRDVMVLTAEHDEPAVVETVEQAAFDWRRPWFPVLLDHPVLRCGPVVVPSLTACHRCFRRRRRQHAKTPELYEDQPPAGLAGGAERVRGYASHHVGIAVGLALQAVRDAVEPPPEPPGGWVRTAGLAETSLGRAGVVAVDGCARCRARRDYDRDLDELAGSLAAVGGGRDDR